MADFGTCSSKFFGRGQGGEIQAKNNISEIASIKLAIKRIDILVICNSLKDGAIQNIKRRNIFASCFMHKSGAFPWLILAPPPPSSLVGAKAAKSSKK